MNEWRGVQIGPLWIHRLEQWDIGDGGVPFLAAHWKTPNCTQRILAVWRWGVEVGCVAAGTWWLRIGRNEWRHD